MVETVMIVTRVPVSTAKPIRGPLSRHLPYTSYCGQSRCQVCYGSDENAFVLYKMTLNLEQYRKRKNGINQFRNSASEGGFGRIDCSYTLLVFKWPSTDELGAAPRRKIACVRSRRRGAESRGGNSLHTAPSADSSPLPSR